MKLSHGWMTLLQSRITSTTRATGVIKMVTGFWFAWLKNKSMHSLEMAPITLLPAPPSLQEAIPRVMVINSLQKAIPRVMVINSLQKAIPRVMVINSLQKAPRRGLSLEKAPLVKQTSTRSRARRDARRALQAAGLPIPETLKPGKAVDDLDPQSREEAKDLQRRLKELTWSSSLPARAMQLEIANVKQKLKELLSEKNDKDEEEEEESDKPSTPSSPSSSSDHPTPRLKSFQEVQRAELEKAQAELEKAKADLEAAENRLGRKKREKMKKKERE